MLNTTPDRHYHLQLLRVTQYCPGSLICYCCHQEGHMFRHCPNQQAYHSCSKQHGAEPDDSTLNSAVSAATSPAIPPPRKIVLSKKLNHTSPNSQIRNQRGTADPGRLACDLACDLRKAFDTVVHQAILEELHSAHPGACFYNFVCSFLENREHLRSTPTKTLIRTSSTRSAYLLQWSILSPTLFNLVMRHIATCLQHNMGCR